MRTPVANRAIVVPYLYLGKTSIRSNAILIRFAG
jgi:hypothetical protein